MDADDILCSGGRKWMCIIKVEHCESFNGVVVLDKTKRVIGVEYGDSKEPVRVTKVYGEFTTDDDFVNI
ncbi:hypothetical protein SARC_09043 [Sphaeroforma arctica JP610]|uniref:Uncharacterized protein n=1 Tax=Sphaeroforma arctica JP610 TaxID=667725 RepID=A0A0L0FP66_9EUKA|nr:hypothetical protein SARC_09043 [Sphaeroforma arctica JP610]KNC78529.1 hypothetical protein SARC_09043 [Sphaeroforma arctica JP610]|eukprot:XP_014152431.1 hypothetical protein SARC_09043 [Sphaeroforma arctica JP610]